jgi:hypothetical protein
MGLFGSKKKKPHYSLSKTGKEWQGEYYDQINRGMDGRGLLPGNLQSMALASQQNAINTGFLDSSADLRSYIDREVLGGDEKIASVLWDYTRQAKYRAEDDLKKSEVLQRGMDKESALNAALGELGAADQASAQVMNTWNNGMMQARNIPGYWQSFGSSIGPAVGMLFGQMMSQPSAQMQAFNAGAGPVSRSGAATFNKYGTLNPSFEPQGTAYSRMLSPY